MGALFKSKIIDNILWHSLYVALSRPLLGFSVGIMIYGISEGVEGLNHFGNWSNFLTHFLGLSKKILEWPPTYILGKLTFSLYLVHLSVIFWRVGITRYPSYISQSQTVSFLWKWLIFANLFYFFKFFTFMGDLSTSFIAAMLLTLFVEIPFDKLTRSPKDKENLQISENHSKQNWPRNMFVNKVVFKYNLDLIRLSEL